MPSSAACAGPSGANAAAAMTSRMEQIRRLSIESSPSDGGTEISWPEHGEIGVSAEMPLRFQFDAARLWSERPAIALLRRPKGVEKAEEGEETEHAKGGFPDSFRRGRVSCGARLGTPGSAGRPSSGQSRPRRHRG